jgi:hypothetical protein
MYANTNTITNIYVLEDAQQYEHQLVPLSNELVVHEVYG